MSYASQLKEMAVPAPHDISKDVALSIFNGYAHHDHIKIVKDLITELLRLRYESEKEASSTLSRLTEEHDTICKGNAYLHNLNNQ